MAKSSGGGLFGSGIFGFLGTTIVCNATDTSMYCQIMKAVNIIILIASISLILYFLYLYLTNSMGKKNK
jgi:hypothetical protein